MRKEMGDHMDKKDLRPSAMTIICYILAIVFVFAALLKAVNSYQIAMGGLATQGMSASDKGVTQMLIGIVVDQAMIPLALSIIFYCIGAVNQRILIQHKELMHKLSLMDSSKTKK